MGNLKGKPITVGYLKNQGITAMDAVSDFMTEYVDVLGREELNLVSVKDVPNAVLGMRRGDIDYLVTRGDEVERVEDSGVPFNKVWEDDLPLCYVVAALHVTDVSDVRALIVDDFAEERTHESLPSAMDGAQFVRYGCDDGDAGARRLKEQPGAYMHGTAVLCSPRACAAMGLRRLTDPFADEGQDSVGFVALKTV